MKFILFALAAIHPCYEGLNVKTKATQVSYEIKSNFERVGNHFKKSQDFLGASLVDEWDYVANPGTLTGFKRVIKAKNGTVTDIMPQFKKEMTLRRVLANGKTFGRCIAAEFANTAGESQAVWIRDDGLFAKFWEHESTEAEGRGVSEIFHFDGAMYFLGAGDDCSKNQGTEEDCFTKFARSTGAENEIIANAMLTEDMGLEEALKFDGNEFHLDNGYEYPSSSPEKYFTGPRGQVKFNPETGMWSN